MNVLLFLLYWLSTFPLLFSHFLHPSFTRSVPLCIFFLIPFFYDSHPCHCGSMALESNYSSPHSLSPPHRILLTLNEKKSRRRERWLVELQSPLAWVHWPHLFCTVIPLLFLSDSHKPCLVISSSFHILPTSSAPQYDSCWWFPCPFVPPRKDSLILLSSHSCLCFNLSLLSLLSSRGIVKMKLSSPSFGKKVLFHCTMPSQERQVRNAECTALSAASYSCLQQVPHCTHPSASSFSSFAMQDGSSCLWNSLLPSGITTCNSLMAQGTENVCLHINMYTDTHSHV